MLLGSNYRTHFLETSMAVIEVLHVFQNYLTPMKRWESIFSSLELGEAYDYSIPDNAVAESDIL